MGLALQSPLVKLLNSNLKEHPKRENPLRRYQHQSGSSMLACAFLEDDVLAADTRERQDDCTDLHGSARTIILQRHEKKSAGMRK